MTLIGEVPGNTLAGETCEWNGDSGVTIDELTIEVGETKEGLNVLDFVWFQPILDNLDLIQGHSQAVGREHVSEVFAGSDVKLTFMCMGKESISTKSVGYFSDMLFVLRKVIGTDQYVIQIDNDVDVYHICKDVIHEPLKSCGSVSKAFWHYQPLKRSITSPEGSLPFVSCCNVNQIVLPRLDSARLDYRSRG